jgi:hypothetical protein
LKSSRISRQSWRRIQLLAVTQQQPTQLLQLLLPQQQMTALCQSGAALALGWG